MNILREKSRAMGWHARCSSAPDTSGLNSAALGQVALSKDQLDWARQIYEQTAPQRADAVDRANKVSDAQLAQMNQQTAIAKDYADYNKSTFRPLEQGIVDSANSYDSESKRNAAAGTAMADVEQNFDTAQADQQRTMARMGVNPSDGATAATGNEMAIAKALGKTQAAAKARAQVETTGFARKMDAASLGRNLPSSQATSASLAGTLGTSAVNSSGAGINAANSGNQVMQTGFSGAGQSLASAGGLFGQQAQIQNTANANDNAWMGAAGSALGGWASGGFKWGSSDKNVKKNIHPVNDDEALESMADDEALEQVASTPVATWSYKDGSAAADGGKTHTGPMAQDVRKTMGDKIAPGGKKIDLISLNGKNMAAIGALNRKVDALGSKVMSMAAMLGSNLQHSGGHAVAA